MRRRRERREKRLSEGDRAARRAEGNEQENVTSFGIFEFGQSVCDSQLSKPLWHKKNQRDVAMGNETGAHEEEHARDQT